MTFLQGNRHGNQTVATVRMVGLTMVGLAAFLLVGMVPAHAIDHDNIDAGRPLSFDDAESIAFRERAFETGLTLAAPYWGRGIGARFAAEYLYSPRVNSHYSIDVDPSIGARTEGRGRGFDPGNIGLGYFNNLNRETLTKPAYALRADAYLPTGRGAQGVGLRVRGILSRTFNQYSRFHINADANVETSPGAGNRAFVPALTLGFTRPLGYPTAFNRTMVAELGTRASQENGKGAVVYSGIGLRQQLTVRSVFDVGIQSDFAGTKRGAARDALRLTAGYSTQF